MGSQTCSFTNGKVTPRWTSVKLQFLMMLFPISFHLSLSLSQLFIHPSIRSQVIKLHLCIPSSQVNTDYSIPHTLYTPSSTVYGKYSITQRLTVSCTQRVSIVSAELTVLNSLHSNKDNWTNSLSYSSHGASLLIDHVEIYHIEVHLSRSIMASKFNLTLTNSWPPSASSNSHDRFPPVCMFIASKCISERVSWWRPSTSRRQHGLSFNIHLRTCSITALKCISVLTWSPPLSACPCLCNIWLQVHCQCHSILAFKFNRTFLNHIIQVQLYVYKITALN
jgi:hypothetical protein